VRDSFLRILGLCVFALDSRASRLNSELLHRLDGLFDLRFAPTVTTSERRPPISLKPEKAGLKDLLVASATISVTA